MTSWNVREAVADELNFIYATWLNSFRYDSFVGKSCTNTVFFAEYASVIDSILHKPTTKIIVAFFPEFPTVILSYMVYEPTTLHYIFTKELYQKNGIAKDLFKKAFSLSIDFTHRTLMSEPIIQKYRDYLNYNPFKLYERMTSEGEKNE